MRYQNEDEKMLQTDKRLCQLCYHTMIRFEIVTPHTSADFFLGV